MAEAKESSLSSQVWVGLIVAAVGGVVGLIYTDLWAWIRETAKAVWAHLVRLSEVPHWLMYVVGTVLLIAAVQWIARWISSLDPGFKAYSKDSLFGVTWRWQFYGDRPIGAWAFCSTCDATLVYSESGSRYSGGEQVELTCETCNASRLRHDGDKDYLVAKVLREVERRIRTGEWSTHVHRP